MTDLTREQAWYIDDAEESPSDYPLHEYEITASPNDFNIITLFNFIERGTVKIPGFQRNYVWDIKRASKLIESLLIGLPIPQIFLYEDGRNQFSVIDGQQRLMSIYYFIQQRFPRREKRTQLRQIFDEQGAIPEEVLQDDAFFQTFNLNLPTQIPNQISRFHGLNYGTLGDHQSTFDLRPIRSIIIKQASPSDDDSAIYEIFNRLNSGGVNLSPQQIRMSLYHSDFYDALQRLNNEAQWRRLVGRPEPDLNVKDIEFMLRGFAMLIHREQYASSMVKFLNDFSRHAQDFSAEGIAYYEQLFRSFLDSCQLLPEDAFLNTRGRFSITIYESVFVAACTIPFQQQKDVEGHIDPNSLQALKDDPDFQQAAESGTTAKANVETRLTQAQALIRLA